MQEASQAKIELKHDDADALERVIANIYRVLPHKRHDKSWRHWLKVQLTADKYLEQDFSCQARNRVIDLALALTHRNTEEIISVMNAIDNEMSHDGALVKLAVRLHQIHVKFLLENDKFRNMVDDNKDLRWEVIEFLCKPKSPGVEQVFCLCRGHESQIFATRGHYQSLSHCTMCVAEGTKTRANAKIVVCDNWSELPMSLHPR